MVFGDWLINVSGFLSSGLLSSGFLSSGLLPLIAILLGAVAVALLVPSCMNAINRFIYKARARGRLTGYSQNNLRAVLLNDLCRNGIALMRPIATQLIRIKRINTWCKRISATLEDRVPTVNLRSLCELQLASALLTALLAFALTGQLVIAAVAALLPPLLSIQRANVWHRTQRTQLREQLPDALNAIGMCFSAGHSLQQALGQVACETPNPLGGQLLKSFNDIDVGYGVSEALERLEQRTDCADLRFVLVALDIQHMTGGSLRELLEGTAASIAESFELMRSLAVQTAQARMSARIVTIMPFALLVLLSLVMPGYLATFFGSTQGFILLLSALGLEALGIFLIRRILGIDLE